MLLYDATTELLCFSPYLLSPCASLWCRHWANVLLCGTTFPDYLLDHNIWQSKLFVMQTLLAIAELQNYWGSRGSRYGKRISGAQWWILRNKIVLAWGRLDSPGRLQSWDSGLPLSENFDGLSLKEAKIFSFEIGLENRTDFEEQNSVLTRFIYLMMMISAWSWAFCAWIRGFFMRGHFVG